MSTETNRLPQRLRDLHRLLSELVDLHDQLLEVMQHKLQRMRESDVAGMQTCIDLEANLIHRIQQRDGLRRQLTAVITRELSLDESSPISARQLADELESPADVKLRAVCDQLAVRLQQIAKVNSMVKDFARQMLEHLRMVFEAATQEAAQRSVYKATNTDSAAARAQVVDATG